MKITRLMVPLLILAASSQIAAAAVQVEGVEFMLSVEAKDTRMTLRGYGILHYMVFIRAYAGAFYLHEAPQKGDVLGPVAKRLELAYFHAIKGKDFATATRQKILENISAAEAVRLRPRIDQLAAMYRDVEPGDRYALTFIPGHGTELALNGKPLGTVDGDDFASAVFAIWLGPSPIDRNFRDQLLGAS